MHARRRQRDRDSYYEERQSYSSYPTSSTYVESNDRQQSHQQSLSSPPMPPVNDYPAEPHYSPTRSPNGGMSSHSHGHSYNHSHSYSYGQSQNYSQSSCNSQNRPYNRSSSHCHHRRRCNYSPETNSAYGSADNSYQHSICDTERDRDYKSSRDKYTDRASLEKKDDSERIRSTQDRTDRGSDFRKLNSKSTKRWNPSNTNGDWSEHISSSGKKYYYNCVSEVSQWEKPREWREKRSKYYSSSSSSRTGHDRRENRERETDRPEKSDRGSHRRGANPSHSNSWRNSRPEHDELRTNSRPTSTVTQEVNEPVIITHNTATNDTRNRNTPLPEVNYNRNEYDPRSFPLATSLPRIISHPTSNGSSVTPPPPAAEVPHHFTGPPTPTHSENHVDHPVVIEVPISRRYEFGTYGSLGSTPGPALTPSLSNYMRSDLLEHVTGWPADVLESSAQRYSDEANMIAKQVTRVSSDLKVARSIVREREINATLQEQKIMYLRQQISELEESMSQNSIMCDDLCQ